MSESTQSATSARRVLSTEAADELVRYLYLLIDEIQFSSYGEQLRQETEQSSSQLQQTFWDEFDDTIPF